MSRLGVAALAAWALAGCGVDDRTPPPSSRTPQQAQRCLRADHFEVRGGPVDVDKDTNAPDHVLFLPGEGESAEVAFYRTKARADRFLPSVRAAAERNDGVLDAGGLAAIFWIKKPDDGVRDRVWRCVFAG